MNLSSIVLLEIVPGCTCDFRVVDSSRQIVVHCDWACPDYGRRTPIIDRSGQPVVAAR